MECEADRGRCEASMVISAEVALLNAAGRLWMKGHTLRVL